MNRVARTHHHHHYLLRRRFIFHLPCTTDILFSCVVDSSQHRISNNNNNKIIRSISTVAAKSLLGFSKECQPTIKELRHAYFEAAKLCHPDKLQLQKQVQRQQRHQQGQADGTTTTTTTTTTGTTTTPTDFRDITAAYEHLLNKKKKKGMNGDDGGDDNDYYEIPLEGEQIYRRACMDVLGIPAEIVEESKQNPMFRRWLDGNTDGAQYWRSFFAVHGGLAPKLRRPRLDGYLTTTSSNGHDNSTAEEGRRRPKSETTSRRKRRIIR